jgi:hypothetical protein
MKKLFMTLVLATLAQFAFGQRQVYVNGYYRSNGTYVQPHYRTSPNNTVYDNWSTYPNVNPYTGNVGTRTYNYTPMHCFKRMTYLSQIHYFINVLKIRL